MMCMRKGFVHVLEGQKKKQNREKKIECEGKKHCQEMSADYLKNGPI